MKKHFQGCPGSYNQVSDIPFYCNCPEVNDTLRFGPGSLGYVAPATDDRLDRIIKLLTEIEYHLRTKK